MRVFVTGGTGFIGGRLVQRLRDRGDDVVALVRSQSRSHAAILAGIGCEVLEGDLNDRVAVERGVEGADAVFHLAGQWDVGIQSADCPKMQDLNIGGVRRVLDAAVAAGVPRIVHASSVVVYGNTRGAIVDETYRRNPDDGYLSCYDESKSKAHNLAESRIAKGAPVVMIAPGVVYGPGDHSEVGRQLLMAAKGKLPALMLTDIGVNLVHVDDVVSAFLQAHDQGEIGHTYIVGGENLRLVNALEIAADLTGRTLTSRRLPTGLLKAISPIAPFFLPRLGYPPNLRELIKMGDGTTFWVDDTRARKVLGHSPRSFEDGYRETLQQAGVLRH
jgi:dihydroflavonol-4-reductase